MIPGKLYRLSSRYSTTEHSIARNFIFFPKQENEVIRAYRNTILIFIKTERNETKNNYCRHWFVVGDLVVNTGWFLDESALNAQFEMLE